MATPLSAHLLMPGRGRPRSPNCAPFFAVVSGPGRTSLRKSEGASRVPIMWRFINRNETTLRRANRFRGVCLICRAEGGPSEKSSHDADSSNIGGGSPRLAGWVLPGTGAFAEARTSRRYWAASPSTLAVGSSGRMASGMEAQVLRCSAATLVLCGRRWPSRNSKAWAELFGAKRAVHLQRHDRPHHQPACDGRGSGDEVIVSPFRSMPPTT